jgi:uncharacterized membrane protein YccF (DUF307 family)
MSNQPAETDGSRPAPVDERGDPSLVVRALWFVFVGWWATGLWLSIAWLLNLTIVGIPFGIKMINLTPKVLTLKNRRMGLAVDAGGNVVATGTKQRGLAVRAAYFLLVGWWASGLWMAVAYLVSLTVVGLPLAIWMYHKLPFVVSLYEY